MATGVLNGSNGESTSATASHYRCRGASGVEESFGHRLAIPVRNLYYPEAPIKEGREVSSTGAVYGYDGREPITHPCGAKTPFTRL